MGNVCLGLGAGDGSVAVNLSIMLKDLGSLSSTTEPNQTEPIKQTTSHANKTAWAKEATPPLVDLSEVRRFVKEYSRIGGPASWPSEQRRLLINPRS